MGSADLSSLRMLRRARDRIDRDYAGPVRIAELAAEAGYRDDSGNWYSFTQRTWEQPG